MCRACGRPMWIAYDWLQTTLNKSSTTKGSLIQQTTRRMPLVSPHQIVSVAPGLVFFGEQQHV